MSKPRHIVSEGMRLKTPYPTMGHAIEAGLIGEERRVMKDEDARALLLKSAAEIKRLAAWNDRASLRYRRVCKRYNTKGRRKAFCIGYASATVITLILNSSVQALIHNWDMVLSWLR